MGRRRDGGVALVAVPVQPSLIWVPFDKRAAKDITFDVAPTFEGHGVDYVHAPATGIDASAKTVATLRASKARLPGHRDQVPNDSDVVPGLGSDGNAYTITTLADAVHAGEGWRRLLDEPKGYVKSAPPT